MMAGVHQHLGLRTRGLRQQERHPPVGDVGVIERRLERLVLYQDELIRSELGVYLPKPVFKPSPALADVRRARIIGAVSEPERDITAIEPARDLDAIEDVAERCLPDVR